MFNQSYNVNVAAAASPTSATLFLKGDDIYLSGQRNIYKRGAIG
jgi:K+/H+ antiporter YhaU regulatory subunit KhtT